MALHTFLPPNPEISIHKRAKKFRALKKKKERRREGEKEEKKRGNAFLEMKEIFPSWLFPSFTRSFLLLT
jgi:hypothetical protein